MKKLLLGTVLLALATAFPLPAFAGLHINIGVSPPPIVLGGSPDVIVLPDTDDVYAVPGIDVDLFFWNGWWWRFWEGRWYRSHYYDRSWAYYPNVPSFYFDVDPGWRTYYREHDWHGHRWNYERIPTRELRQNWKKWRSNRHWEKQRTWGIQKYEPRPQKQRMELRHQRQEQYRQRPEVQQHQRQMREQKRQPQVRQPHVQQPQRQMREQKRQPQSRQPQKKQEQRQGKSEHQKYRERPERGDEGRGR
jgi:hypothetical protein